tara:strand:+ start:316 stop:477 length:162 start_codon:yes stop_codon:yes gene_type:complete
MGDAPRHIFVMSEMRKPRYPWEGESNGIELRAGHMELVIYVWEFDASVGITGE